MRNSLTITIENNEFPFYSFPFINYELDTKKVSVKKTIKSRNLTEYE
jgi:hypothetical protein